MVKNSIDTFMKTMTLQERIDNTDLRFIDRVKIYYDDNIMTKQTPLHDIPEELAQRSAYGVELDLENKEMKVWLG